MLPPFSYPASADPRLGLRHFVVVQDEPESLKPKAQRPAPFAATRPPLNHQNAASRHAKPQYLCEGRIVLATASAQREATEAPSLPKQLVHIVREVQLGPFHRI